MLVQALPYPPAPNMASFGPNIISNGGFDDDSDWNLGGPSISDGKLIFTGNSFDSVFQFLSTATEVADYLIELDISDYAGGNLTVDYLGGSSDSSGGFSGNGHKSVTISTLYADTFFEMDGYIFTGSVDNLSIRKIL